MLPEKTQKQAIQYLIDKTGHENWTFSGLSVKARQCAVYQLSCSDYPTDIALKIYHNKETSRQLQGQYKALERFSISLNQNNTEYRTPEPFGCFAGDDYFLMEWMTAPSLDEHLWKYFYNANRQQTDIKKTYSWLKHYHQAANPILQEVNLNYYYEQLKRHIKLYDKQGLISQKPIFAEALKVIKKYNSTFSRLQINHADSHGDFTPTNILIGKENILGIDIGSGKKMPIENDMALMLNYISIDLPNMLTNRHMSKSIDAWTILNIALDAYSYPKDRKQRHFFLFVFLYQTIRRWLIINNRNMKKPRLIDKWRLRNSEKIIVGLNKVLNEYVQS